MRRRSLLQGLAAAAAILPAGLPQGLAAATARATRRVRPADAAWPSAARWQRLKDAVGGNLVQPQALFAPCQGDPKSAACGDVLHNLRNPFYLGDQPGGTQVSGWLDAWTPAPSAYAVAAHSTADIVAAVNFARENNLRLVVKGTGHSYQGTSNAPDSLLIWTRAMNKVELHDAFVPQGCDVAPVAAVSAQSGAVWIDLYEAVTTEGGRYVQGGGCTDVGVAGLIQSGGFGSFSKGFGSAASSLLEAQIVTADGQLRLCNAQNNPDLFWAIKGGGGGSWGVVTRLTLRTHELPAFFGGAWGKIQARSDAAYRKLIAHFLDFYAATLLNPHWGEQVSFEPGNVLGLSMVCQGLDKQRAKDVWRPFFDWVAASPQDFAVTQELIASAHDARHWWDVAGNDSMTRDPRPGAPPYHAWWHDDQDEAGAFLHGYDSLWLPASLLQPDRRQRFTEALFAGSRYKKIGLHINKGLAGAPDEALAAASDTATNPAVNQAFALAIIADGEAPTYPGFSRSAVGLPEYDADVARRDARLIDLATAELRRIAPDAGSYVSESNYFNPRWQDAFWGRNYKRLRGVKAKYDPDGLFFVHHGVGSEDWSADGFTRLA